MPLPRIPFATIAELGLGAFVAVSVGVTLYLSATAGVRSTQVLLAQQAEDLIDDIDRRLEARLRPVDEQAGWIAQAFADRRIGLADRSRLDAFMFGALGATPQVNVLSVVQPSGKARRWIRGANAASEEDWSGRQGVMAWVLQGGERSAPSWRPPLWGATSAQALLLHDTPLHVEGRFVGMLAQVVPLSRLSADLADFARGSDATPFVIYGKDRVLAHPYLALDTPDGTGATNPLPNIAHIGDPVLARIRSPDSTSPFGMRELMRTSAATARVDDRRYLIVYRDLDRYGPEPWTLGAYLDPERGSGSQMKRVMQALAAGLLVLVAAVAAAAVAGRRISAPVQALARAARAVRKGRFADVAPLPRSAIKEFDDASRSFNQMVEGLRESRLVRETLGRFLPEEVARGLLSGGGQLEPIEAKATVLVSDIEDFALLTDSLGPSGVVAFLNSYFEVMAGIIGRHRGVITQFQGDAILAVFNVPIADPAHGANALQAAIEMMRATDEREFAGVRVRCRIGLSTGRLVAGAVGSEGRLSYTVHGNAVNLASRLEGLNKEYGTRILVSGKTAERCEGHALRKVADAWVRGYGEQVPLFTVDIAAPSMPRAA